MKTFILTSFSLLALTLAACNNDDDPNVLRASGTIEATEVRLATKMPGLIRRLTLDEGSLVRAGETVAVIDHDLVSLQLQQAEAGAEVAGAQLALLRRGARPEDIAAARANQRQAQVQLNAAQEDLQRIRALVESGSATQKQLDDAESRASVLRAQVDAAAENVQKLNRLIRPEEIQAAEAQLKQARASGNVLRRQIQDAYVVSPISGVVTEKSLQPGELATAGAPILTLANLEKVYLRIYVPETELGRLRLRQPVDVVTDAYPDRPLRGTVTFISPEAEFTPKNVQTRDERVKLVYEVKVDVPNPRGILKPGMYADAILRFQDEK